MTKVWDLDVEVKVILIFDLKNCMFLLVPKPLNVIILKQYLMRNLLAIPK